MNCWSCGTKVPDKAKNCPNCEAEVMEQPTAEEEAAAVDFLNALGPEVVGEMLNVLAESTSGEDFVNRIMIGDCPKCESSNTSDCEHDPEIEDPCIGRCLDCGQLWCVDCEEHFADPQKAAKHDCPAWEGFDDEDEYEDDYDEEDDEYDADDYDYDEEDDDEDAK